MKLENMDKVDPWTPDAMLGLGWHNVTIDSATEGTSSGGFPQLELTMSNQEGSIRDWQVVIESSRGKVKQILEAAGVEVQGGEWDFQPSVMQGRKVRIKVGEEPKYSDPTQTVNTVQAYTPPLPGGSDMSQTADTRDLPGTTTVDPEGLPF